MRVYPTIVTKDFRNIMWNESLGGCIHLQIDCMAKGGNLCNNNIGLNEVMCLRCITKIEQVVSSLLD